MKHKTVEKEPDQINFLSARVPGGIEAQEKRGQAAFVTSDQLPVKGTQSPAMLEKLLALGFVFGKTDSEGLFIEAKLPEGWKKVPTDHSMWSELRDEKGNKRASVFYKAAFYDRDARFHLAE